MGKNSTSLDDVKKNIKGWADSEILDDKKKELVFGGKNANISTPKLGSLCGDCIPG